jgi:hypothetical protein
MLRQQVNATEFGSRDYTVMSAKLACLSIPWTSTGKRCAWVYAGFIDSSKSKQVGGNIRPLPHHGRESLVFGMRQSYCGSLDRQEVRVLMERELAQQLIIMIAS